MTRTTTKSIHADLLSKKTYAELVVHYPPRTLHDKADYQNALEVVHALIGFELNQDQADYIDLVSQLIETYESEHVPYQPSTPGHEVLAFLMNEHEMSAKEISVLLNVTPSIVHRILKGERNLTAAHIKALTRRFQISADAFLGG